MKNNNFPENEKLPLGAKIFGVVILALILIGVFSDDKKEQNATQETSKSSEQVARTDATETINAKPAKTRIYIEEVYKLQQLTEQLVNYTYKSPYPSFDSFSRIKKNLEKSISPTCDYFGELVSSTGNATSKYRNDSLSCQDTVQSMMVVLFDIRDGDYQSINAQRQKLININENLVKKLDEYRNTAEYQEQLSKAASES